jgi:hypothetical protein
MMLLFQLQLALLALYCLDEQSMQLNDDPYFGRLIVQGSQLGVAIDSS